MKKEDFKKLALLGITGGLILATSSIQAVYPQTNNASNYNQSLSDRNSCAGREWGHENGEEESRDYRPGNWQSQQQPQGQQYQGQPQGQRPMNQGTNQGNWQSGNRMDQSSQTRSQWLRGVQTADNPTSPQDNMMPNRQGTTQQPGTMQNRQGMQQHKMTTQQQEMVGHEQPISESAFYSQLDQEGKRVWNTLDGEARQLAIRLSKQFSNKNQAVREAQRHMSERKGQPSGMRGAFENRNMQQQKGTSQQQSEGRQYMFD